MGAYWIPIILGVVGFSVLGVCVVYNRWRMRLHDKGILDFNYDGHEHGDLTIADIRRLEKEHDEKEKDE